MKKVITSKKIIPALAAAIILGLCAVGGYKLWKQHATEKNYSYEVYDDHVELLEYLGNEKNVTVPDTLKGKPVTVIKEKCFSENEKIQTVHLGRNIREIEKEAFMFCYSLEHVTGEAELEAVSEGTFEGCHFLWTVEVGNHVKRIEDSAFFGCYVLSSIGEQPELEDIGNFAFMTAGPLMDFRIPEHTKIGWKVFLDSIWLQNQMQEFVVAGEGCLLAYNGPEVEYSFFGTALYDAEVVEVPHGVVKIADYSFAGCETAGDIKEIRLPVTVTEVETRAFENCGKIRVYMPESVTAIDSYSLRTDPDEKRSHLGAEEVTIVTTSGSYAEEYAQKFNLKYEIVEPWW